MEEIKLPKTSKGNKTFQKIIKAAEKSFYESGYTNATIKMISEEAGVSVGSIYVYFPDKKTIYDYLLSNYSKLIRSRISSKVKHIRSRRDVEKIGFQVFFEIVKENKYLYNIIWESLYIDKQKFIDYYMSFSKHYIKQIEKAKKLGTIATDIDSEVLAWSLMGMSNFLGLRYVMFNEADDLEEVAEKAMNFFDPRIFSE